MHGLEQRWLLRDPRRIALDAPFAAPLGELLGIDDHPFLADPRASAAAHIVGIAVVRAVSRAVAAPVEDEEGTPGLTALEEWSHDVPGLPAGAVLSAGSMLDATRLTLHYGLRDAIIVGSATVAAEGLADAPERPWHWQAETPLEFGVLAPVRDRLAEGIRATRRDWQALGLLSERARPALVVVTAARSTERPRWLDAPALHTHADGSRAESWLLTSEAGAENARRWVSGTDLRVLACSPAEDGRVLDAAAIPRLLRDRLDARLVGHDGGRATLETFRLAGALPQLDLTLVGAPTLADTHPGRAAMRFFGTEASGAEAPRVAALLGAAGEQAWVATLDPGGRS